MSLYTLQRDALKKTFQEHKAGTRHLIVDDATYPIVRDLFKEDILNYVYTFYKIDDENRSTNKDNALYLLDPVSPYTIACLLADFKYGKRYKDAVVYFMTGMNDTTRKRLKANRHLMEATSGKLGHIECLGLNPIENKVYTSGCHYSIPAYYNFSRLGNDLVQYQMDKAVQAMMSMCILTGEYPIVRYYNSPLAKGLANMFQDELDNYYRRHTEAAPMGSKTVFLVTDRSMDMFGPFCHYKYYRAQIFDTIDNSVRRIRGDYTYVYDYSIQTGEGKQTKHLVFDQDDPVYSELKDMTMEEYTDRIVQMLNKLKREDAKYSNLKYTSDLSHAALNQSDHIFNKQLISGHFELISMINNKFQADDILDLVVFENKCASNMGPDKQLHEQITDELINLLSNPAIFMGNKIRLILIYAFYRGGLIKPDFVKLLTFSMPDKVESVQSLIRNMACIGPSMIKPNLRTKPKKIDTFFDVKDTEELTERMVPTYTNLVKRLAENRLPELYTTKTTDKYASIEEVEDDEKTFPYVRGSPVTELVDATRNLTVSSGGSGRFGRHSKDTPTVRNQPKWKSSKPSGDTELTSQKFLIFCAGGLTQSELSTILSQESSINKNIFVGTDEIYSVWDMIGDIRMINDDRRNFEFPLDQKFAKREPPAYLEKNSGSPTAMETVREDIKQHHKQHHHHSEKPADATPEQSTHKKKGKFMSKFKLKSESRWS